MIKASKGDQKRNMELVVAAFEENYSRVLEFLPWKEQNEVKLSTPISIQSAEGSTISASPPKSGRDSD